jgi:hypothetical protein
MQYMQKRWEAEEKIKKAVGVVFIVAIIALIIKCIAG